MVREWEHEYFMTASIVKARQWISVSCLATSRVMQLVYVEKTRTPSQSGEELRGCAG